MRIVNQLIDRAVDLNERVVGREIHRRAEARRAGPTAENVLIHLDRDRTARILAREGVNHDR